MATKGYPTQKKLANPLVGVTDKFTKDQYQTYQPTYSDQIASDVVNKGLYRVTAGLNVTAASTNYPKRTFTCTAHGGSVGDVVRFQPTGTANPGYEATILAVPDANTIVLGAETPNNIATSDAFYILRHVTPIYGDDGTITVNSTSGPIQFVLNGADTEVEQNTGTPANSRPLPVIPMNTSGSTFNAATLAEQQTQTTALTAIQTAVQIMDDWDESDRAKVNLIVGQAGISAGAGNVAANTPRVTLAADQAVVPANIQQLKGTAIDTNSGTLTAGTLRVVLATDQPQLTNKLLVTPDANSSVNLSQVNGVTVSVGSGVNGTGVQRVTIATDQAAVAQNHTQINGVTVSTGSGVNGTGVQRVTIATDQAAVSQNLSQIAGTTTSVSTGPVGNGVQRVTEANVASATLANVAGSASSVTLLASSASRMGAAFYNDSTAILYLKFGATASTTSFTVKLQPEAYYEIPIPVYSGVIDGIWASATGSCRVTSW